MYTRQKGGGGGAVTDLHVSMRGHYEWENLERVGVCRREGGH